MPARDGANKDDAKKNPPAKIVLDKKFKGSLPITELTEDEAILHALNRLAYGPRPSDVEHIRQMGLDEMDRSPASSPSRSTMRRSTSAWNATRL